MKTVCVFLAINLACVFAQSSYIKDLIIENCGTKNNFSKSVVNCVLLNTLQFVDHLDHTESVELISGVSLNRNGTSPMENEVVPLNNFTSPSKILDVLLTKASDFMSNRVMKVQFNSVSTKGVGRALEEGRGKIKKVMSTVVAGIVTKVISVAAILIGGLFLLTTKALIVGKVAFVVAALVFVQNFFSNGFNSNTGGTNFLGGFGHGTSYGVPTVYGTNNIGGWGGSPQYPYARAHDD